MKKVLTIIALTILVWGCAKKITPSNSVTGQSNNGSPIAAVTPSGGNAPLSAPLFRRMPVGQDAWVLIHEIPNVGRSRFQYVDPLPG